MGCHIEIDFYKLTENSFQRVKDIEWELNGYGTYGFLANVRNYSNVPCISEPRGRHSLNEYDYEETEYGYGGFSHTIRGNYDEGHSHSWLLLTELLTFNYDQEFVDIRDGANELTTIRNFLGEGFFNKLKELQEKEVALLIFNFNG